MRTKLAGICGVCLFFISTASAESELAPAPRLVENHVQLAPLTGGYQIILSPKATLKLSEALGKIGDGHPYTDVAKLAVKELNDPEAEKKVEMLAWAINTQAPALKKALDEKAGPGGAIIKVFGLEKKTIPERPFIKAAVEAFAPREVKDYLEGARAMINTTPLYWRVEGRK
jgi:hypothetical protein